MMLVGLTVPIQVGFCVWLLYRQLGVAAFGGLAFLVILMPAQVYLGQIMHSNGNSLWDRPDSIWVPVMAAVAVRKKVVSIGHFSPSSVTEILLDQIKSNCMY